MLSGNNSYLISGVNPGDGHPTFTSITNSFTLSQGPLSLPISGRSFPEMEGRGILLPPVSHLDSIKTMELLTAYTPSASSNLTLSRFILSGSRDGVIKVWN